MRIWSKFKDYYDHSVCYVVCGDDLLYRRHSKEYDIEYDRNNELHRYYYEGEYSYEPIQMMIVGFCGSLHRVWFKQKRNMPIRASYRWIHHDHEYFYGSRIDAIDKHKTFIRDTMQLSPWRHSMMKFKSTDGVKVKVNKHKEYIRKSDDKNWIMIKQKVEKLKLFEKYKVPIFSIRFESGCMVVTTNPCLKDIGFSKLFSGQQAHQELEMYMGNDMIQRDDPDQITDDLVLAQQKGFDKWSFRQQGPKNKKRKRSKLRS